jgi:phosphotransferase system enzyme I (PtsI)
LFHVVNRQKSDQLQKPAPVILKGLGVSAGIVIGRVLVVDTDLRRVPRRTIAREAVKAETARLDAAVKASIDDLHEVQKNAEASMGKEASKIFLAHSFMLRDNKMVISPIKELIASEQVNSETAVAQVFGALAARFRKSADSAFTTKVNDIDDLAARVLNKLMGESRGKLKDAPPDSVVIARDLTPSQTASFDRKRIVGFATDLGGRTGHTAIVARALEIPAVVGLQGVTQAAVDGSVIILDGDRGNVILNPDAEQLKEYRGYIEQRKTFQLSLGELVDLPSVTTDGTTIELMGNIEFPDEAKSVVNSGGDGVGLYRTEFIFLTRDDEPTEKDHFTALKRAVELLDGKPLTIRTFDLGADKYTQERALNPERNPFLGCRSIRYSLQAIPMFKRQLRAILRASALGPVKVMFPLITSTGEFRHAKYIVNDVMEDLEEDNIPFDRNVKIGMMVEVPSAALMADTFAREVDFFSIGTNDLVQYTLAVDRTNERVATMYNPFHPAVLHLIRDVIRAARRREIPVSCCGEAAGDIEYALLLIGLGLRTLSVTSTSIPGLKRLIRSVNVPQCERIARHAMSFDSESQVSAYLRDRARKIVPEAFDGRAAD